MDLIAGWLRIVIVMDKQKNCVWLRQCLSVCQVLRCFFNNKNKNQEERKFLLEEAKRVEKEKKYTIVGG